MAARVLLEDRLTIQSIDNSKFERVSRISGRSGAFDAEITIDINSSIYPVHTGEVLTFAFAESKGSTGGVSKEITKLMDEYDYVCHGKVFNEDEKGSDRRAVCRFSKRIASMRCTAGQPKDNVIVPLILAKLAFGGVDRGLPLANDKDSQYTTAEMLNAANANWPQFIRYLKSIDLRTSGDNMAIMEMHSDDVTLFPNAHGLTLERNTLVRDAGLEETGRTREDLLSSEFISSDPEINKRALEERLSNRHKLPRLPSWWQDRRGSWWQEIHSPEFRSNSLGIQFMGAYQQSLNRLFHNQLGLKIKGLSFKKVWKRFVLPYSNKYSCTDLRAMTGHNLPTRTESSTINDLLNTYMECSPVTDWVRHPDMLKRFSNIKKAKDQYEESCVYYSLFSLRMSHLKKQAFPKFSQDYLLKNFKYQGTALSYCPVNSTDPTDMTALGAYGCPNEKIVNLSKRMRRLEVKKDVEALLNRNFQADGLRGHLFDSAKVPLFKSANAALESYHTSLLTKCQDSLEQLAAGIAICRTVHHWFESTVAPVINTMEPDPSSVRFPEAGFTQYDKEMACVLDTLFRFDTDPMGWFLAKYYCNEPYLVPGTKKNRIRTCKLTVNENTGEIQLQTAAVRRDANREDYDLVNDAPGTHAVFHVKDAASKDKVVLPGFSEMFTRFDELKSSKPNRVFTGQTSHFAVDKMATSERHVFKPIALTNARLDELELQATRLIKNLPKSSHLSDDYHTSSNDDGDDEAFAASLDSAKSIKNHPVLGDLESISKGQDEYMNRGILTKTLFEALGYGFDLSYPEPPSHVRVKRKTRN